MGLEREKLVKSVLRFRNSFYNNSYVHICKQNSTVTINGVGARKTSQISVTFS